MKKHIPSEKRVSQQLKEYPSPHVGMSYAFYNLHACKKKAWQLPKMAIDTFAGGCVPLPPKN
ncbi:MAG: hypothetical protein LBH84_02610 [Prevotellaceae bacterium]|nr:hypothetical protein [Prevotellaceae bacterium]